MWENHFYKTLLTCAVEYVKDNTPVITVKIGLCVLYTYFLLSKIQ